VHTLPSPRGCRYDPAAQNGDKCSPFRLGRETRGNVSVPIGDQVTATGLMLRDGRRVVLQVDDGGMWELDLPGRREWAMLGLRVR